jgi:hypothetical protein
MALRMHTAKKRKKKTKKQYTELSTKAKLERKTKMCGINVLFPMYLCKIPQGCKWEEVTRI